MPERSRTFKAGLLAMGNAATALVGILIAAFLSRHFDKTDYATYRQTLLSFHFISPFLALGLPAALFYFIPRDAQRARQILVENLVLLGTMGLLFSAFLGLGGNRFIAERFSNPALERTLLVFALYPAFFLPASATNACLVVQGKLKWLTIHTLGTRVARLVLVLAAVYAYPGGPTAAVAATALSGALMFGSGLFLMLRSTRSEGPVKLRRGGLTNQLRYAVPLGFATMLESMALGIDKVLVSMLCETEEFAVFVNGAMEIPFIGIITGAAASIILPEVVKQFKDGEKGEALRLWQRASRKVAALLLPLGGFLFALAPDLMTLLYSSDYVRSADPFRIYLLLLPTRVVVFATILQAAGRSDLILRRAVGTLILNTAVSYPLIKAFGIEGAAWGTVLVVWLYVIPYCMVYCGRLANVSWFKLLPYRNLGAILLAVGAAAALAIVVRSWLSDYSPWVAAGAAIACYGFALVPAAWFLCRAELWDQWQAFRQKLFGG